MPEQLPIRRLPSFRILPQCRIETVHLDERAGLTTRQWPGSLTMGSQPDASLLIESESRKLLLAAAVFCGGLVVEDFLFLREVLARIIPQDL